jgi:hypothetical protein
LSKIKRVKQPGDFFTIVPNATARDAALTWGARGLVTWLLSHTEDYDITEVDIIAAGPTGRDGARALIRELETHGYLKRERTPISTGGSSVDYVLMDPRATENPSLPSDGKPVPRSDQEEQAVSPGKPNDGNSVPRSTTEDQKKNTKTSSSGTAKRGTRVPDDFQPDEKMRAWFRTEGIGAAGVDGRVEHERFMDFWRGKPGSGGVKLDWPATWRNWMRSAAERANQYGSRPVSAPPGTAITAYTRTVQYANQYRPSTTDQKLAQTLELGRRLQMEEDAK